MAGTPRSKELNRQNMIQSCELLSELDYCIFYGTALGIHREGDTIEGDDDVDLLLNKKDYDRACFILRNNGYNYSSVPPVKDTFCQFHKTINKNSVLLDLYFYEDYGDNFDYVCEKWNVQGKPFDKKNHLHIPKDIIFPIKKEIHFGKEIKVPNNIEKMSIYVYGERFMEPLRKNIDYMQLIHENKFRIVYLS